MALFKCDTCHHFQETSNDYIGKNALCPKCQEKGLIHNTISYAKEITEKYMSLLKSKESNTTDTQKDVLELYDSIPLDDFNVHNTDIFSQKDHYSPIVKWFNKKNIQTAINPKMMDTTGFFDEVAVYIGDHFNTIGSIVHQIRYIQTKQLPSSRR